MEGIAQRIRGLARDLCPSKPLGEERCAGTGISSAATEGDHPNQGQYHAFGSHLHQSTSGRNGRIEKRGPQSIGRTRGGWNTKLHMAAASDRDAVIFSLSPGQSGEAPEGRALLQRPGPAAEHTFLLMDRAYEGDETRDLAATPGYTPVVPPKCNRKEPWEYDKDLYKLRNQVERIFRRLKRFRRIFTRYDKL